MRIILSLAIYNILVARASPRGPVFEGPVSYSVCGQNRAPYTRLYIHVYTYIVYTRFWPRRWVVSEQESPHNMSRLTTTTQVGPRRVLGWQLERDQGRTARPQLHVRPPEAATLDGLRGTVQGLGAAASQADNACQDLADPSALHERKRDHERGAFAD